MIGPRPLETKLKVTNSTHVKPSKSASKIEMGSKSKPISISKILTIAERTEEVKHMLVTDFLVIVVSSSSQ